MFNEIKKTDKQYVINSYDRIDLAIESGFESTAVDASGKQYIDFTSGIGVNSLGYSNPKWSEAVAKQAEKLQHISNYYYNSTSANLAKKLAQLSGMARIFFANSGCEANECAIKIARKTGEEKGRYKIITLENSFHGRTITTLAANGQEVFHKSFLPLTKGFSYAKPNDINSVEQLIDEKTCGVMVECVQGEGGVFPLDNEFLKQLRALCDKKEIVLIIDEVQTGIGRTGEMFAFQSAGILPDILTIAKGLGGGLPIGGCLVSDKHKDVLAFGDHGSTFGANPVCAAGANAVLEQIANEEFLTSVKQKGEYFKTKLEQLEQVEFVRGKGLMLGVKLKDKEAKDVLKRCVEEGLLILTAKDLIRFLPPLNISYQDIDNGLLIFKKVLEEQQ